MEAGKSYYFTRNGSTIVAFTVGKKAAAKGVDLFKIIGCHTDSPCLKTAPVTKVSKVGCQQINMQTYGGGIWRTWFDRDLGLAGKVVFKGSDGTIQSTLWDSKEAWMSIPSLCIHLDRDSNTEFKFNKENHLKPILASACVDQLFG